MKVKDYLIEYGISVETIDEVLTSEKNLSNRFKEIDEIAELNSYKVLSAMRNSNLSERHFNWSTGYGYNDDGRDVTEKIYSKVFKSEDALVRMQIVNGTHAITLGLRGLLKNGDRLILLTGETYDTLIPTIGKSKDDKFSLFDMGVSIHYLSLIGSKIDLDSALKILDKKIDSRTVVYVQRSCGYDNRATISIDEMQRVFSSIKEKYPETIIMVDNCYGEFCEDREPIEVGADLIAGSLIKNPGGTLALSGGYLCGKSDLISDCSAMLTTPAIRKECGLTFGQTRNLLQGLFLAPKVVASAVKSAILSADLFSKLGYSVSPTAFEKRSDIVQRIELRSSDKILAFCKAIQFSSAVDSYVTPVFAPMPGYDDNIIMADGCFVQGSSIELSADAPIREPYNVFLQGATTYEYSKLAVMCAYEEIKKMD